MNHFADFSDHDVILATHDDTRLGVASDAPCRFEQTFDGPRFLVIRRNASDESLAKAAAMFSLPMQELVDFRTYCAK